MANLFPAVAAGAAPNAWPDASSANKIGDILPGLSGASKALFAAVEPAVPSEPEKSKQQIEERLAHKSDKFAAAWKGAEEYANQLKSGKYLKSDGAVGVARGSKNPPPRRPPQVTLGPSMGLPGMAFGGMGAATFGFPGMGAMGIGVAGMGSGSMGVGGMGMPGISPMGMARMSLGAAGMPGAMPGVMAGMTGMGMPGMLGMGTVGVGAMGAGVAAGMLPVGMGGMMGMVGPPIGVAGFGTGAVGVGAVGVGATGMAGASGIGGMGGLRPAGAAGVGWGCSDSLTMPGVGPG